MSPVAAAPEKCQKDRLIHDLAGGSLSKQFKDKVLSFLTPPPLRSVPSGSDTTFFLLLWLRRSSARDQISRKWIGGFYNELRLFVITQIYRKLLLQPVIDD